MCALSGTDCSPPAPTLSAKHSKHRHHVLSCRHVLPARGRRRCAAFGRRICALARRRVGAAEASLAQINPASAWARTPSTLCPRGDRCAGHAEPPHAVRASLRARGAVASCLQQAENPCLRGLQGRPSGRGTVTAAAVLSRYIVHVSLIFRPPPAPGFLTFAPRSRAGTLTQ